MYCYTNDISINTFILLFKDIIILSPQMIILEKIFKNRNISIHYTKTNAPYILMEDINLYVNSIILPSHSISIEERTVTRIIDTIYLMYITNNLYICDVDTNEKFLITQEQPQIKQTSFSWNSFLI